MVFLFFFLTWRLNKMIKINLQTLNKSSKQRNTFYQLRNICTCTSRFVYIKYNYTPLTSGCKPMIGTAPAGSFLPDSTSMQAIWIIVRHAKTRKPVHFAYPEQWIVLNTRKKPRAYMYSFISKLDWNEVWLSWVQSVWIGNETVIINLSYKVYLFKMTSRAREKFSFQQMHVYTMKMFLMILTKMMMTMMMHSNIVHDLKYIKFIVYLPVVGEGNAARPFGFGTALGSETLRNITWMILKTLFDNVLSNHITH